MGRNINKATVELIHFYERCRLKAYMPTRNDRPTIGWGNTFYDDVLTKKFGRRDVKMGDEITQAEADSLFVNIIDSVETDVEALTKNAKKPLRDNQFGALVSFAFNVGSDIDADTLAEGLGDSTLLKKVLANPDDPTIRAEFMKWNKQAGQVLNGLTIRRKKEADLYFS